MYCEDFRRLLSPFLDNEVEPSQRELCVRHLDSCPLCRNQLDEARGLVYSLRSMPRPVTPQGLEEDVRSLLSIEDKVTRLKPHLSLWRLFENWAEPRLAPYAIGAMATIILFLTTFVGLRPHLAALHDAELAARGVVSGGYEITQPVSLEGWARDRAPFGVDSPSLNPKGALAALTMRPSETGTDDDMVIITDVFTDGRAAVADVVQPPRDQQLLADFQDALRENAAFVPAAYDNRPQTMRVVFVFQRVAVREQDF